MIAVCLRDDFRAYLPELLPRFIGLFAEAERSGNFDQVTFSKWYLPCEHAFNLHSVSWVLS